MQVSRPERVHSGGRPLGARAASGRRFPQCSSPSNWSSEARERRDRAHGAARARGARAALRGCFLAVAAVDRRCCSPTSAAWTGRSLAVLVVGYASWSDACASSSAATTAPPSSCVFVPILRSRRCRSCRCSIGARRRARRLLPEVIRRPLAPRAVRSAHLADSWFCIPPVLVLAALAPGEPPARATPASTRSRSAPSSVGDLGWALVPQPRCSTGLPLRDARVATWLGSIARSTPIFIAARLRGHGRRRRASRCALLAIAPLVWLLQIFSRDREERYANALELQRAYRGTVMLLSDVVESEDSYTAEHSRSVVELVNAVADELGVAERGPPGARVRGPAPRRRQDRDPQGDPEQARQARPTTSSSS